jgi:iron complex transport system ATP-binding protein
MHELTLALQYADRLCLLSGGRLVAVGPSEEIVTEELVAEHYRAAVQVIGNGSGPIAVVPRRRERH